MLKSAGRFILYRFVFMKKAPYTKRPLSISEQLARLEERGLLIDEKNKAERYLRTIGYFRLSAYFYPLLLVPKMDHLYKAGFRFTDALNMYRFDRKLRLFVFSQIEKIEIAVRASIVRVGVDTTKSVSWFLKE